MAWLDVFSPPVIRPTCPTTENKVGRNESLGAVDLPHPSHLSHLKKDKEILSEEVSYIEDASPAAIAHARRMLVDCPSSGGKLHCWRCSHCGDARTCSAWRGLRSEVERLKHSGKPYSLCLAEEITAAEVAR